MGPRDGFSKLIQFELLRSGGVVGWYPAHVNHRPANLLSECMVEEEAMRLIQ